jgi:ubiquinone biosynthesis protein
MTPAQFRQFLERRGPIFMKVGQFLAMRPDLLPQEYCDELMKLLDRAPPFPWAEARAILTEDLKRDPNLVFDSIEPEPIAAGSLAQVHRAVTKDGAEVAVKIQRPGIAGIIRRDLRRARFLARLLEQVGVSLVVAPREVVAELSDWLHQELDFHRELANLQRLFGLLADSRIARIPRPYPALCTSRVLVAEYLRGIRFTELLRARSRGTGEAQTAPEHEGIDYRLLSRNLITSTLQQIFDDRFFHADLHAGNLLALKGDVIGYVDFGLCDELDPKIRASQMHYLAAVYNADQEAIFQSLTEILIPTKGTDLEAFRRDFEAQTRESRDGGLRARENGESQQRTPFAEYLIAVMRAARKNRLQVPARVLSLYRALLAVENVTRQMGGGTGILQVGREFFFRRQLDELMEEALDPRQAAQVLVNLMQLTRDGPRRLNQVLAELADGSFTVGAAVSETGRTTRLRNERTRLIAASILTVTVSVLLMAPEVPWLGGISLYWPLWGVLACLALVIGRLWRRLQ